MMPLMSRQKPPLDALTLALAGVLRTAVKDAHRDFPTLGSFKDAVHARADLSADTVERILNGRSSIRLDYLGHMAALLGTTGSALLAQAEQKIASVADLADARMAEQEVMFAGLVESLGGTVQDKPTPKSRGGDGPTEGRLRDIK